MLLWFFWGPCDPRYGIVSTFGYTLLLFCYHIQLYTASILEIHVREMHVCGLESGLVLVYVCVWVYQAVNGSLLLLFPVNAECCSVNFPLPCTRQLTAPG